ncbi:MAG: hypothetical protein OEW08_02250 [Gammaproteobacteria bacterium]|nr:hypothetical protein [Gammaproteobacteria bacterium]
MKSNILAITLAASTISAISLPAYADRDRDHDREIPFETIARGSQSGVTHQMDVVIRNAQEFEMLWMHHSQGSMVAEPMPKVDFEREVVVGVFLGYTPSCGYDVKINDVEEHKNHTQVRSQIVVSSLPLQCLIVEEPYELIKIPRSATWAITFRQGVVMR